MSINIFGNFDEKSTFIESLTKVNNFLNFYFENSRFPESDQEITLSDFQNQILPDLSKCASVHIKDKPITNNIFFQQIKLLIGFYVKLIQKDNINISSLLLQILLSIYINFPDFMKDDTYKLTDILTINVLTDLYQLLSETSQCIDIYILVLLLILIQNENIGNIEDTNFIPNYITKFDQCINTFNYEKTDSSIFVQIFWVFSQILPTFPYYSSNDTDNPNFFNSFLNFSIKSIQSCQSIEKQRGSIRFINSLIDNTKYSLNANKEKPNTIIDPFANTETFNYDDYMASLRTNSDSIGPSSKSDSLDIVHDFSITSANVNNNPLFVAWAKKFNPLIALINSEGHRDILQEIDILIQKILKIYKIENEITEKVTLEVVQKIATRIENADSSTKKIFAHEFVAIFTFLSEVSDEIAIKYLQKVTQNFEIEEEEEDNETKGDEEGSDSITIISNSTLFELGNELVSNPSIYHYILSLFETQIYDKNDPSTIKYFIEMIHYSKKYIKIQLNRCLDVLQKEESPPQIIYEMLSSLVTILDQIDTYNLFKELISISSLISNENESFRNLVEKVAIKCNTQPNERESVFLIHFFCMSNEGWKSMQNIFNKKKMSMFKISGWKFLMSFFCQLPITPNSLDFLILIFPYLLKRVKYEQEAVFYNEIFIHLLNDYIQFENNNSFETYMHIETFLPEVFKLYLYKSMIEKLKNIISDDRFENKYRAFDFFRMIIERREWNMDFSSFQNISTTGAKVFKRLKKLKKPSNALTIHISVSPPESTKRDITFEVTPDTMLADITVFLAVGLNILSDSIEVHALDDQYYHYYENMRTDSMYVELSKYETIKDQGINEKTDLRMFYSSGNYHPYQFNDFFPSELLSNNAIQQNLLAITSNQDDQVLARSAWKLLCLLRPLNLQSIDKSALNKCTYTKLYYMKLLAFQINENPAKLQNENIKGTFASIVSLIINEEYSGKLLSTALSTLMFEKARIPIADGGSHLLSILIKSFIEQNNNTFYERILTAMTLAYKTHRIPDFDSYIIENEEFLKKCALLNASSSFKKQDLIKKFFSDFNPDAKQKLFDIFSRIFMETNENCLSILMETYTENNDLTELFDKSIKLYLSDNSELSSQYIMDLASFIDFILIKRSDLISSTSDTSLILISKVFNEINSSRQAEILKILLHYVEGENANQAAINSLINYFQSFSSSHYKYDPLIQKQRVHYCGLTSLGMTCYMNSILQQLAYNPLFRNTLLKLNSQENQIALELQKIVANLELSTTSTVNTEKFAEVWKAKGYPQFNKQSQEDASEFFRLLIDHLPADLQKIFTGENVSIYEGIDVSYSHSVTAPFLTNEIPVSTTFENAMKSISAEAMFVGSNQYNSEEYGKIDVSMKTRIVKFPNTFVIQLKRFDYSLKTGNKTKISKSFSFLTEFNTRDFFEEENNPNIDYVLKGVVTHAGTAEGGHYNSIIKIDDTWVLFNDSEVQILTDSQFDNLTKGGGKKDSVHSCAYILFYVAYDPKTHEIIRTPISDTKTETNEKEEKVSIPEFLVNEINKENEAFTLKQCMFSYGLERFVNSTNNIDIILPYFLNVFSHSAMIKSTTKLTQNINSLIKDNPEKGFDFFFDHKSSDELLSNSENLAKTIDILLNGEDELVQPFIFLLRHLIQEKSKKYQAADENIKKDEFVLRLLLKIAKENAKLWKNVERFGLLIHSFVENYKDLFIDQQIKPQICLQIIDIIKSFYESSKPESQKQIDLSKYISSLSILNESVENVEILESFILEINPKISTSKMSTNSFSQLISAVSKRSDKVSKLIKKETPTVTDTNDDELPPFNHIDQYNHVILISESTRTLLKTYVRTIDQSGDIIGFLNTIDNNDSDSLITFLISRNFAMGTIYHILTDPQYSQQKLMFMQILKAKPLILTRMAIIPDFNGLIIELYQTVFPYINFYNNVQTGVLQSAVPPLYKYYIDTMKLLIRMQNYPWPFNDTHTLMLRLYPIYFTISEYLTKQEKQEAFNLTERVFLEFTSYVDLHKDGFGDDHEFSAEVYRNSAKERRKYVSLNNIFIIYLLYYFDEDQLIQSFEKYSKYYIRYGAYFPLSEYAKYDFRCLAILSKIFIKRPDLFIRVLQSDEVIYLLKNSSESQTMIKLISDLMKHEIVRDYVLFELMAKMPMTIILNGTFLKLAVSNVEHLTSQLDKGTALASSFVNEFFENIDKIIKKNRFFSSMLDIGKIVQTFAGKADQKCHTFTLTEKAKTAFLKEFLPIINEDNNNKSASDFVALLCSQNEEFANFVVNALQLILSSKAEMNDHSVQVSKIVIKDDVISSVYCWKLISMAIEFSKDFENAILPVSSLLTTWVSSLDENITSQETDEGKYRQTCIEKLALFVNESNAQQFRESLFDAIVDSCLLISEQISPFISAVIKFMDEEGKGDLLLGNAAFMTQLSDTEKFIHSFRICAIIIQSLSDPNTRLEEIKETFPEVFETIDEWPEECDNQKHLFQII